MPKDDIVKTHIVIRCGFNNLKSEERHSEYILNLFYECIEKIQDKFPNAIILIGEIISHPFSGKVNRRIQVVNALLQEKYHDLNGRVRYVEHPILSKDRIRHTFFDDDRVHLNIPGILKMLSDFYRVGKGKHPFVETLSRPRQEWNQTEYKGYSKEYNVPMRNKPNSWKPMSGFR